MRDRIVREMFSLFNVALAGAVLLGFVFEVRPFERLGAPDVPWWLGTAVAVVVGIGGGLLTMRVVSARALRWTKTRWLKHGRQLPADV
ncbi:hypothetical protein G5V59_02620 [Nocardioides sp. W3-2-3]|uniref:hypothetical protein n=1 Tax=Nocardioides convexus TaxID=2712224 RepID=UPI00241817FD|nr:hypothetical protein [Nocardioides convexus]NGZ99646.1 hypothetical protein [Nocardioides convexus]